jgi:hypothetical protein
MSPAEENFELMWKDVLLMQFEPEFINFEQLKIFWDYVLIASDSDERHMIKLSWSLLYSKHKD